MTTDQDSGSEQKDSIPPDHLERAIIPLGNTNAIDLSHLTEEEQRILLVEYTRGAIDVNKRASQLAVDVKGLEATLQALAETTRTMSSEGDKVTISHTQDSSAGRTEILMGNTDRATSGRFSKSQTGEKDWTPYYIAGGLVAGTLIVLALINSLS